VLAATVMIIFAIAGLDPVLNLFFWMSAVTVISLLIVEVLVSVAVVRFFKQNGGENLWRSTIAPVASAILLLLALYLLMSRFNLLAGTVPEGVDPSLPESAWQLNGLGWFLVLLPFIAGVVGYVWALINKSEKNELTKDMLS
jgi:small-conductance mechanosensitive channel